jgi:hypothetical protein
MNGLLDALAHASAPTAGPAGVGWLLPLALATVELEYTVRHGSHVDLRLVAHACDDVRKFLDEDQDPAFAARYAVERASSSTVARMHEAALDGCRRVSVLTERANASDVRRES